MSAPDFLNMSDEDLLAYDASQLPVEKEQEVEQQESVEEEDSPAAEPDEDAGVAEVPDGEGEGGEKETESEEQEEEQKGAPAEESLASKEGEEVSQEQETKKEVPEEKPETVIDYKAEYERLTAPFKANGRDIQVKSVDDAITLMQMGANYNKKMAALKPNLKLLKLLENNGLLSEEKLSYLIDLEKKNPAAINKLVQDSGLDPMDLDAEKASAYKPNTYAVDDREIELDSVLDEIQGTSAYNRTLEIVSNKWDGQSKQVIANSPQLLKVINDHVERGIYDIISREIESERVFGRLNGLSDIEAYRQVGDAIQARGGFDHLAQKRTEQGQQVSLPKVVVPPKPKQADDDKLREKRRAASSTKPVAPKTTAQDYNPLALSDEEFSKIGLNKFL